MPTATVAEAIDILKYHNYQWSRKHEGTMPSDWYLIWGKVEVDGMERRYQEEVVNANS